MEQFSALMGHTFDGLAIEWNPIIFYIFYIIFLELVPITIDFSIWVSDLSGKRVIIHTDTCNETLVSIFNFYSYKFKRVMCLLGRLILYVFVPQYSV